MKSSATKALATPTWRRSFGETILYSHGDAKLRKYGAERSAAAWTVVATRGSVTSDADNPETSTRRILSTLTEETGQWRDEQANNDCRRDAFCAILRSRLERSMTKIKLQLSYCPVQFR